MRWCCWYFYYWKRCCLRRVTAILLQQKNFGPNVIYSVVIIRKNGTWSPGKWCPGLSIRWQCPQYPVSTRRPACEDPVGPWAQYRYRSAPCLLAHRAFFEGGAGIFKSLHFTYLPDVCLFDVDLPIANLEPGVSGRNSLPLWTLLS